MNLPAAGPSHVRIWLGFALAKLAFHLVALTQYGWFRDEFYYVACARRLAWGYVDHPPLSIAVLAAVQPIVGDSLALIRLVPALAGAATICCIGRLTRDLGGGGFAQALACLAALLAPIYFGICHFYSMNAFDLLLWTLATLALVSALRHGGIRWAILGVVVGLGLLNKISMLWFAAAVPVALLLTGHRRHLMTPWPYVGGAIAAALFLHHLIWQMAHGWPTLEFIRNATRDKMVAVSIPDFLLTQFRVMGPVNAFVYVAGLLYAFFAARGRAWAILGIVFVAIAGLLIAGGTSRANYLTVAYPMLLALGGMAWESWLPRGGALRPTALGLVGLLNLPLLPLALPILPVESFVRYQRSLGLAPSTEERKEVGPLPQHYADMFGWPELVDAVALAYQRLTPDERRRAVVFGQNYGEAGAIDVLGRPRGLPRAISGHNHYWLWGPGDWDGEAIIIIGGDADDNAEWFEEVEQVATWDHPYAMPYERGTGIFIGRRLKRRPISEAWPLLKHFD